MARAEICEFYLRHRFVAYAPDSGEVVTLSECYQDPFSGSFVLARGYEVEGRTLFERLSATKRLTIYLLGKSRFCRPIDITYSEIIDCLPTLAAHEGGIALDLVELKNPSMTSKGGTSGFGASTASATR